MIRRPRRVLPASLAALVLLAACVLVALWTMQLALGEPAIVDYDTVAATVNRIRWIDQAVWITGGAAALLGVITILTAVVPGRSLTLALTAADSPDDATITRSSLRTALRAAAHVDGVTAASVKLRRRQVRAVVRTNRTSTDGIAERTRTALRQRLELIGLAGHRDVTVAVKTARSPQ